MKKALAILTLLFIVSLVPTSYAADKMKIGVTLHPYYSWVKNIVEDRAEVIPLIPVDADPHSYQPQGADIEMIKSLNMVVVNGMGHDTFLPGMLKAADRTDIDEINVNEGLPLIKSHSSGEGDAVVYNSHTYISIVAATQQISRLASELGKRNPENADFFRKNASAYNKKLRMMLADALGKIKSANIKNLRIATVHDGYDYLMQDLGIEVAAVIQPRHGIEPNPKQLADTIKRLKAANVNVLFTEVDYEKKYTDIIEKEAGVKVYKLSHISNGPYSADHFEKYISGNIAEILKAVSNAQ